MLRSRFRYVWAAALSALLVAPAAAQQTTSKVRLDASETLFSVIAAISHCGYASGAGTPQRQQVLAEIAVNVGNSEQARTDSRELCVFYADHRQADPNLDLAQYVSLALNMEGPPKFDLKVKEADLPPDTTYVLGLRPLLIEFEKFGGPARDLAQARVRIHRPHRGLSHPRHQHAAGDRRVPAPANERLRGPRLYRVPGTDGSARSGERP